MKLHQTEGLARVIIGAVGAALVALAIKAGMLLSSVQPQHAFATLLVFCMVAGISERLVPSLVERVEATAGKPEAGATIVQEASAKQSDKGKGGIYTFHGPTADDKISDRGPFHRFEMDEMDDETTKRHGGVEIGDLREKEDQPALAVVQEDEVDGGKPQRSDEHKDKAADPREPDKAHDE
jgi:hypothetical protein